WPDDRRTDCSEPIAGEAAHVRILAEQVLDQRVDIRLGLRIGGRNGNVADTSERRIRYSAFLPAAYQRVVRVMYLHIGVVQIRRFQAPLEFRAATKPRHDLALQETNLNLNSLAAAWIWPRGNDLWRISLNVLVVDVVAHLDRRSWVVFHRALDARDPS